MMHLGRPLSPTAALAETQRIATFEVWKEIKAILESGTIAAREHFALPFNIFYALPKMHTAFLIPVPSPGPPSALSKSAEQQFAGPKPRGVSELDLSKNSHP